MMARKKSRRDDRYEKLYAELLTQTELLHQSNKRRIRRGLWGLLVMPLVMAVLLWLTDSSRIVFLLIWVLGMFVLSAYLITVEYLDSSWKKHRQKYSGWTAQIIQHEIDHLSGIII